MTLSDRRPNRYRIVALVNYTPRLAGHRPSKRGVEVLEPDRTDAYRDLIGDLARLRLARPALYALASKPMRHTELTVALTGTVGIAVHSRTLANALQFLVAAGLVARRDPTSRTSAYEITAFGSTLVASLRAADRLAHEHGPGAHPPAHGPGPSVM